MINIVILFFMTFFSSIINIYAEGLSTLAEVGKSQEAMQKALDKETKSFEAIKKAIEKDVIKNGVSQDVIKKRYGNPVVILPDKQYTERWVYKPGYASWFGGIKIYLFFNGGKKLVGIKQFK